MKSLLEAETLTATLSHGVARVVLTRADQLNPFDDRLHADFIEVLELVSEDQEARVMLLSSTGRAFSAGGDIRMMQEVHKDPTRARRNIREGYRLMRTLLELRVPLVCAVQGAAMGLGANIAFASDAVVAVRSAKFADSHVLMGLVAGDGGAVVWPQAGGIVRAKRYLLTGDPISATEAFAAGMVTDLVDTVEELLPAADALTRRLADLPPLAVQGTKRVLNRLLHQRAGEVLDLGLLLELDTIRSADLAEATSAFLDKRAPSFEGR
jgi:enoyl-CoA hydratase